MSELFQQPQAESEGEPDVMGSDADLNSEVTPSFAIADENGNFLPYSIHDLVAHFNTNPDNPNAPGIYGNTTELSRALRDSVQYGKYLTTPALHRDDEGTIISDGEISAEEFAQMIEDITAPVERTYSPADGNPRSFSIKAAIEHLDDRPLSDAEVKEIYTRILSAKPDTDPELYEAFQKSQQEKYSETGRLEEKGGVWTTTEYLNLLQLAFPDQDITLETIQPGQTPQEQLGDLAGEGSSEEVGEIVPSPEASVEDSSYKISGKDKTISAVVEEAFSGSDTEELGINTLDVAREIRDKNEDLLNKATTEGTSIAEIVDEFNRLYPEKQLKYIPSGDPSIPDRIVPVDYEPVVVEAEPVQETVVEGSPEAVAPVAPVEAEVPASTTETLYRVEGGAATIAEAVQSAIPENDFVKPSEVARVIANNTDTDILNDILNNGTTIEEIVELYNVANPDNQIVIVPKDDPARSYEIKPVQLAPEFNPPEAIPEATVDEARDAVPTYKVEDNKFVQKLNGVDVLGVQFVGEGENREVVVTGRDGKVLSEDGYVESYFQMGENELQVVGRVLPEGESGVRLENFTVNNDKGERVLQFDKASITPFIVEGDNMQGGTVIEGNISIGDTEANGLGAIRADKIEIRGQEVTISNASASNIQAEKITITNLEAIRTLDVSNLQLSDFNLQPVGDKFNLSILDKDGNPDIVLSGVVLEDGNIGPVADVLAGLNMNSFLLSLTGGEAYTPAPRETVEPTPAPEIDKPAEIKDYNVQNLRDSNPTYEYKGADPDKPTEFSQFFDTHKVGTLEVKADGSIQGYGANGEPLTTVKSDSEPNVSVWRSLASINGEQLEITGEVTNLGEKDVLDVVGLNGFKVTNEAGDSVLSIASGRISPEITKLYNVEVGDTSSNGLGPIEADIIVVEGSEVNITNLSALEGDVKAETVKVNLAELRKEGQDLSNLGNRRFVIAAENDKFNVTILGEDGEPMVVIKGAELNGENNLGNIEKMLKNLTFNSFLASMVGGTNLDGITPLNSSSSDTDGDGIPDTNPSPTTPSTQPAPTPQGGTGGTPPVMMEGEETLPQVKDGLDTANIEAMDPASKTEPAPQTGATQPAQNEDGADTSAIENMDPASVQTPETTTSEIPPQGESSEGVQGESDFSVKADGSIEFFVDVDVDRTHPISLMKSFEPHLYLEDDELGNPVDTMTANDYNARINAIRNLNISAGDVLTKEMYNNAVDMEYYKLAEKISNLFIRAGEGVTFRDIYDRLVPDDQRSELGYIAFERSALMNQNDQGQDPDFWTRVTTEDGDIVNIVTPRTIAEYLAKDADYIRQLEESGKPFIQLDPREVEEISTLAAEIQADWLKAFDNAPLIQSKLESYIQVMEPSLSSNEITARATAIMNYKPAEPKEGEKPDEGMAGLYKDYLITSDEYELFMKKLGFEVSK
jgi:hypothetical protein